MSKVKRSDRARSLNTPDARRYTEWVLLVKDGGVRVAPSDHSGETWLGLTKETRAILNYA